MESMLTLTGIIMIVFGILQIILFFKIWGMTNDVNAIKNKYLNSDSLQHSLTQNIKLTPPSIDSIPYYTECGNDITFADGKKGRLKSYPRNRECSIYDDNNNEIIYNNRNAAIKALYIYLSTGEISDIERYKA